MALVGRSAPGVTNALAIPREATVTAAVTFIMLIVMSVGFSWIS